MALSIGHRAGALSNVKPLRRPRPGDLVKPAVERLLLATPLWLKALGGFAIGGIAAMIAVDITQPGGPDVADKLVETLDYPMMLFMLSSLGFAAQRSHGREHVMWLLLLLGAALSTTAETIWDLRFFQGDDIIGFSMADAYWLLAYIPWFIALILLNREHTDKKKGDHAALDALVVTAAISTLLWQFVIRQSTINSDSNDTLTVLVNAVYPAVDIGLLWVILRPNYGTESRWDISRILLLAAFGWLVVADLVWYVTPTHLYGLFTSGTFLMMALAALFSVANKDTIKRAILHNKMLASLLLNILTTSLILVVTLQSFFGETSEGLVLGTLTVMSLLLVRLSITLRDNRLLLAKVEKRSTTDELTGLGNHRYFHEHLTEEVVRAQRQAHSIGLLIVDIDRFKKINDLVGNKVGDLLLRSLAQTLDTSCRTVDIPCRVGGDQFAVIAPEATLEVLSKLGDRIVTRIRKMQVEQVAGFAPLSVTVSVGCCLLPELAHNKTELLKYTDRALSQAKQEGRDRAAMYTTDSGSSNAVQI